MIHNFHEAVFEHRLGAISLTIRAVKTIVLRGARIRPFLDHSKYSYHAQNRGKFLNHIPQIGSSDKHLWPRPAGCPLRELNFGIVLHRLTTGREIVVEHANRSLQDQAVRIKEIQ